MESDANVAEMPSSTTERQMEYIRLLQARNRLKRRLETKSKQQSALEARERGFEVHFAGANQVRLKVKTLGASKHRQHLSQPQLRPPKAWGTADGSDVCGTGAASDFATGFKAAAAAGGGDSSHGGSGGDGTYGCGAGGGNSGGRAGRQRRTWSKPPQAPLQTGSSGSSRRASHDSGVSQQHSEEPHGGGGREACESIVDHKAADGGEEMTVVEYEDDFDDDGLELSIKEIISQEGTNQLAALLHSFDASTLHADDRRDQLSITNFSSDEEDIDEEEPVLSAMNQLGADYAMNDAGTHMGMNTRVLGAIPATSTSLQSESPFSHPGVDVMMTAISTKSTINTPRRTSIVSSHTDSSDQVTAVLAALQREATVAASATAMSQVNHLQAEHLLPEGLTLGSTSASAATALQDAASVNGILTADTNTLVQPGYNSMAALHSDKTCALATAVMPANISSALFGQQQAPTAQSDDRRCSQYGQCDPFKAHADSSIQIAIGASVINNGAPSSIDVSTTAAACGASDHQHRLRTEVLISQIHSTATLDAEECNSIGVAVVQHTLGRVDSASEASVRDSGFVDDVRHQLQQQQTLAHTSIGEALGDDSSQVGTGAEQFRCIRCSSANSNTTTIAAAPRRRRRSMVKEPASADISMGDAHQVAAAASAEVSSPPSRFIAAGSCTEGSVRPPDWLTKTATADPPAAAAALRTWAASDPLPDDKRRCGSGSSGTSSNSRRQRHRPLGSSFEPPRTVVDTADVDTIVPCLLAAVSANPQGRAGTPQHDGRSTAVPTKSSGTHVEVATDCHTGRRRHSDPPPHNKATVQVSNPQATQEPQSRQRRRHADATTDRSARRENHITYDAITAAQLKAIQACEDDLHDVLGQLLLRERRNQLQAQMEEQGPVLERRAGTCEEDKLAQAHLQLSWDSLSFLGRNSKSRLGAAAAPICRNADAADLKTCAEGAPEYGKPTTRLERAVKVSEALAKVQLVQAQLGALSAYSLAHQHTDAPEQQQPQPPLPLPPPTAMAAHDTPPLPDMGVANDRGCNQDNKHASIGAQHQSLGHQRSSEFDESVELNEAAPLHCLHQVMPDVPFECPVLPSGCVLKMELLSTWGDPYYIGLAGVDLFDEQGQVVTLPDPVQQVVAHPCLKVEAQGSPGAADPRTADKLFDGVNDTCDDLHMWLAPHDAACGTTVTVQFHLPVTLSAMRIWNYSKSREHSYRGVRRARISLDSAVIFDGEIRKAAPGLPFVPERCELILFTLDEELVQRAEATGLKHLPLQQQQQNEDEAPESATYNSSRPTTAEVQMDADALPPARHVRHVHAQAPSIFDEVGTDAAYASEVASERVSSNAPEISQGRSTITDAVLRSAAAATSTAAPVALAAALATAPHTSGRMLRLRILSTWGSKSFCGLTGVAILEQVPDQTDPVCVSLGEDSICCLTPWSGASGLREHLREPANLLDGNTQTLEQRHMWKAPFSAATGCTLQIDLGRYRAVAGIILWNYNRSDEDASIGARLIQFELDGSVLTQAIIRRAPGSSTLDYGQLINLDRQSIAQSDGRLLAAVTETQRLHRVSYLRMPPHQDYETLMHPTGMLLQIVIHSSWGDHYYVGLDALEVMGADGKPLPLEPAQVCAVPCSLAVLGVQDARIPGNLAAGSKSLGSKGGASSWLAPIAASLTDARVANQHKQNHLLVMLSVPSAIAAITFWNYTKTPSRGVRQFSVLLDGALLFMGTLCQAFCNNSSASGYRGQALLFTNDHATIAKCCAFGQQLSSKQREGQDVICIDEREVRVRPQVLLHPEGALPDGVPADARLRPLTAMLTA